MYAYRHLLSSLLVLLLGWTAGSGAAGDTSTATAPVVINTGLDGGGYWNVGNRLQTVAGSMGLAVENRTSTGSISNLRALLDAASPVSLALAQADALQSYLDDYPDAAARIETLGSVGRECVFIISNAAGDIKSDKDMARAQQLKIGIKSPNSGIRVTFDHMRKLMPELDHMIIVYGDAVNMITRFANQTEYQKVVMVVHDPDARSPEIDMVIANPDKYRFVAIKSDSLTRKGAAGAPVYEKAKVKPGAVDGARAVETICVRGLLLANRDKLSPQQHEVLGDLVATRWNEVSGSHE